VVGGRRYVPYARDFIDARGGRGSSKAGRVLEFLMSNAGEAFYSTVIVERLSEYGVQTRDVMVNARRWEGKGLVCIRGYKTDERQSPFREGYMLTWIDQEKPREGAVDEAVERESKVLRSSSR
jgi:hypothetical protein